LLEERLAGRRELDMTPGSHQERGTQLVLQIFNALAQRRLRNTQQRRCPSEMQGLRNRSKIPELDQIHV
jgi:hypothetical protein